MNENKKINYIMSQKNPMCTNTTEASWLIAVGILENSADLHEQDVWDEVHHCFCTTARVFREGDYPHVERLWSASALINLFRPTVALSIDRVEGKYIFSVRFDIESGTEISHDGKEDKTTIRTQMLHITCDKMSDRLVDAIVLVIRDLYSTFKGDSMQLPKIYDSVYDFRAKPNELICTETTISRWLFNNGLRTELADMCWEEHRDWSGVVQDRASVLLPWHRAFSLGLLPAWSLTALLDTITNATVKLKRERGFRFDTAIIEIPFEDRIAERVTSEQGVYVNRENDAIAIYGTGTSMVDALGVAVVKLMKLDWEGQYVSRMNNT